MTAVSGEVALSDSCPHLTVQRYSARQHHHGPTALTLSELAIRNKPQLPLFISHIAPPTNQPTSFPTHSSVSYGAGFEECHPRTLPRLRSQ